MSFHCELQSADQRNWGGSSQRAFECGLGVYSEEVAECAGEEDCINEISISNSICTVSDGLAFGRKLED